MTGFIMFVGRFFSPWHHPFRTLLMLILLVSFVLWKYVFHKDDQNSSYITAPVERADIQNLVTATGILQPLNYVDVGAQVSGQLKKLNVVVGTEVKAGDLLAEIDATVYKAKVDGIRAQLLNLKAQLSDKQSQLTLATFRYERQKNLRDDATTKEAIQTAEASLQSAQAQLQSVQAQIQQTDSSLRAEEANLAYAKIYAPMSGTVVTITSRQGQTLNANQQAPTIMRIADLTTMTVQTQVSEADISKLKIGMPVYFTTLGGGEFRWNSKLSRVEPTPTVSNSVVLYNALFEVPNNDRLLMTQMSAQVFFVAASAKDSLIVPASAINFVPRKSDKSKEFSADKKSLSHSDASASVRQTHKKSNEEKSNSEKNEGDSRSAFVQVIDENGKLSQRDVVIGISNRVDVQVLEGLREGETVVVAMRLLEKQSTTTPAMGPGASASRMMR